MPGSLALRRRRSTRPTGSLSTCGRPSRGLRRAGSGVAQVGHPGAQLVLVGAGELRQRVERALQDVGGVVRLDGEVAPLPPERPLAFVALVEARLAEPAREPGAGVAPAGGRHALHHRSRPAPASPRRPTAPGGGARTRAVSLDVDAGQLRARELLPQHREHRPDAAADLEHTRPGLERRPAPDQPVSPVLGLRPEPLLLGGAVAVHVAPCAHAASIGADPRPRLIARRCSCPTSKAYPSWMPDDQQKGGEPPPSPRGSTPPPRRPRLPGRWWIVFGLALLAFNFYLGSRATQPASRVRIPYSPFFLQQVKADHVKQITSKGTAIQGTFTQKIRYGSAKPTTRFRTACCSRGRQGPARRCWRGRSPARRTCRSSRWRPRSSLRRSSGSAPRGCATCSSRRRRTRRRSCSSTSSTRSAARAPRASAASAAATTSASRR